MKNLAGLPERWAVNIKQEAEHHRMGEFKEWINKETKSNLRFSIKYYGYMPEEAYVSEYLPESVTLITLDRFFEALDGEVKATDWQPKRGEMVEVSDHKKLWDKGIYYGQCQEFYLIEMEGENIPMCYRYIRHIDQPTTLNIEDAKKAYIKALGLEGKKIDWV